jgi:hypothetical protein
VLKFRPEFIRVTESGDLLKAGVFYGYTVAVMEFVVDGFGKEHPTCFRAVVCANPPPRRPAIQEAFAFQHVEGWAALP